MTREIAHQKSFEKALYSISGNFPPGKLPPVPEFSDAYFKMSRGAPVVQAPWNSGTGLELVEEPPIPADPGGDGSASVQLSDVELATLQAMKERQASDTATDPRTGAELGEMGAQDEESTP